MVELTAKSACAGLLPVTHGNVTLREIVPETLKSVAPFRGQTSQVSTALRKSIGAGLPDPGRALNAAKGEIIWGGQGQYFVIGGAVPKLPGAVTDQTDAWAFVALEGAGATDVLARLCPLDLHAMDEGDTARSLIGHMNAVIIRRSDSFDLMVFRSMAKTLVHELSVAMKAVAARAAL
ncbi:MAG: sarcosine oxidase subunit gamma [Pseudomonadota bacterium]